MKKILAAALVLAFGAAIAGRAPADLAPAVEKELLRQTEAAKTLAANPVVVKAVLDQNARGPIPGMTNEKWKSARRSDDLVRGFVSCEAGKVLVKKVGDSEGLWVRAFLSGSSGEKVAFTEKTISYLHAGQPKFDVPFSTGKAWQGAPELDTVTQKHDVQIAVPVLSGGKTIGVLVVGVSLDKIEKVRS